MGMDAREVAEQAMRAGRLAVSAMTFWEIAMLQSKQRLMIRRPLLAWQRELMAGGLVELPVTGAIGIAAAELDDFHADPADRLIVATAREHGATLVTADRQILDWPGGLQRHDARL